MPLGCRYVVFMTPDGDDNREHGMALLSLKTIAPEGDTSSLDASASTSRGCQSIRFHGKED